MVGAFQSPSLRGYDFSNQSTKLNRGIRRLSAMELRYTGNWNNLFSLHNIFAGVGVAGGEVTRA